MGQRSWTIALLVCFGLIGAGCETKIDRTHREHATVVSPAFAGLANVPAITCQADKALTKQDVEQDLDQLEWLLENRYSYLKLKGVDYRSAMDAVRVSASDGTTRAKLALQVTQLLALLGDGHSGISDPDLLRGGKGFAPFLLCWSNGRLFAFKPDRSGFLDEKCPFVSKLDDMDIEVWLKAANRVSTSGSPQFKKREATRTLRGIQYLRSQMGLPASNTVAITLASSDNSIAKTLRLPLSDQFPIYGSWPKRDSHILQGNIGYLRIPIMEEKPEFIQELVEWMVKFKHTDGLIIDVRGNGGGSRAPLRALLPFFMKSDSAPRVLNVAAFRLGHGDGILADRWLYPANWQGWSAAERKAIEQLSQRFHPEWQPPAGQFSQWHYLVIGPRNDANYYHYGKPVIVLMNEDNFSATDIFLCAFKGMPHVTLMGTPSGGGSGRFVQYRLANSLIGIKLSSMASFQPNGRLYDGNGIQPDVLVEPAATDLIGRTDSIMEAALSVLKQSRASGQPKTD